MPWNKIALCPQWLWVQQHLQLHHQVGVAVYLQKGKYSRRQFEEVVPMLTLEPSEASAVSLVKTQT